MILLDSRFMQSISFLTVRQRGEGETKCLLAGCEHVSYAGSLHLILTNEQARATVI